MTITEKSDPLVHIEKSRYLWQVIKNDPFELVHLFKVALTTAKYRFVVRCVKEGTIVGVGTKIINSANVHMGKDGLLQDSVYIRAGTQGQILMGDRVAINSFARLFGHGGIEIGDDTQIGPGSLITTTDHDVHGNLEAHFKRVVIGKRVWIGANVTILPGVSIGDYAVIGAGAVVTKDIPARSVAVGVPARVIKQI